jgi:hypothetical protein
MLRGKFAGYAKTIDQAAARAAFEQKHGYRPVAVHDGKTVWLVGPILSREERLTQAIRDSYAQMTLWDGSGTKV